MIVDINILLYASISTFGQHRVAKEWLDEQLSGSVPVGLPWSTLLGYLRLATNGRMFTPPASMEAAWDRVTRWLEPDVAWIPQPTDRHADVLGKLLSQPGVHGNLVPDAHLAALAIEHGQTLCSADADFARFAGLRWLNPLA